MTDPLADPSVVQCEAHGPSPSCILCRHLRDERGLGYLAIAPEADEPAQAWCEGCDTVLERERGWNDDADEHAAWDLVCTHCFVELLGRHTLVSEVEGVSPDD